MEISQDIEIFQAVENFKDLEDQYYTQYILKSSGCLNNYIKIYINYTLDYSSNIC